MSQESMSAETDMVERLDLRSADVAASRRQELLNLFPEAAAGEAGSIDVEQLRRALGDVIEAGKERYGLTWPGKADSFRTIQTPSTATLLPIPEESVAFDTTKNIVIEGDNLEVLKLLQKSYIGQIKMIYIDPPYNTGNDFIYPDNFAESLQTYLSYTGQVDAEGRKFSTNTETSGRFHTNWLNMIYPRLYLARNLLREDGCMFVTIDDKELSNLRKVCDEIFGEDNFVGTMVWRSRTSISNDQEISLNHNYVVIYAKDRMTLQFAGEGLDESEYSNPDNDPRGPWKPIPLDANKPGGDTRYGIKNPNTGREYFPPNGRSWSINSVEFNRRLVDGRISFGAKGDSAPKQKLFLTERKAKGDTKTPSSVLLDAGTTQSGTEELMALFEGKKVFDYPKPTSLINRFLGYACDPTEPNLVLDFFAGSGSTGDAVLEWTGGQANFILVQLPEQLDEAKPYAQTARGFGLNTIADICKERLRRVVRRIRAGSKQSVAQSGIDLGFRVFHLAESNFEIWDGARPENEQALEEQLHAHIEHIRPGRSDQDLLYEILLKSGFTLDAPTTRLELGGTEAWSIQDGALIVSLDRDATLEHVRAIADARPVRVVMLDAVFAGNDQLKANAAHIFKSKNVAFKTV